MLLVAETLTQYLTRLSQDLKIKMAGRGAYSVVFDYPPDRDIVVKVSAGDRSYLQFIQFCRLNEGNRWLPQVLDVHKLEVEDQDEVWAVFLQRLTPASAIQVNNAFKTEIAPWVTDFTVYSDRARLSFPEWKNVMRMASDPQTRKLALFLITHFNRLDLLTQNFMMRGSQLVFNDPLSPIT